MPDRDHALISQFSPQRTNPETLERILVQRHELVAESVAKLRESILTGDKHHLLFIGPRGAGKTHLIALIHHRLGRQKDLADRMRFAWLNEDETSTSFLKLLVRIYRELSKTYPKQFPDSDLQTVFGRDPDQAREMLGAALLDHLGKGTVVLLMENLDALFTAMPEIELRTWRAFVQNHPVFATAATAQSLFAGVADRDRPFFGFFDTVHLSTLSVDDATILLEKIAEFNEQPALLEYLRTPRGKARIRAIHHLSGGNPRLYIIFSDFLTRESLDDLVQPFEETVDKQLTAYYQERIRWLSHQQQEIVQFLCQRARPVSVKDIAEGIFATHNTLTSQLKQLREKGYVSCYPRGREVLYELAEPLMRLSFQAKETHNRQPLSLIVDFLRVWYDRDEIEQRLLRFEPQAAGRDYFEAALEKLTVDGPSFRHAILKEGLEEVDLEHCDEETLERLECLAIETNDPGDWSDLAMALYHCGEYLKAIKRWSKVLSVTTASLSQVTGALVNRGVAYGKVGLLDDEIADYTRAIELPAAPAEQIAVAYFNRGVAHEEAGRFESAIADFNLEIELPSISVEQIANALFNRGIAHGKAGRRDEEIADFTRVIELRNAPAEQIAMALNNRGAAHGKIGRSNKAIADFTSVIELPNAPAQQIAMALSNRGIEQAKAGSRENAVADLRRVIGLPNASAEQIAGALTVCAITHQMDRRYEEAIADYTKVIHLVNAPPAMIARAVLDRSSALRRSGSPKDALEDLARLFQFPDQGTVEELVFQFPRWVANIFVQSAFGVSQSTGPGSPGLSKFIDFFKAHKLLIHLGEALVNHLSTLAASNLNSGGLDHWAANWEALGSGHAELEIPLRMLRVGIAWIKSRDENSLLELPKEERQIVRSALHLPPEAK